MLISAQGRERGIPLIRGSLVDHATTHVGVYLPFDLSIRDGHRYSHHATRAPKN